MDNQQDNTRASENQVPIVKGLLALSPLLVFLLIYMGGSLAVNDFYAIPITMAFLAASCYAIAIVREGTLRQRIQAYSRGAAQGGVLQMIWIFIMAGAFAGSAKDLGAIDQVVSVVLWILPGKLVIGGMFLASCLMSLSIGTSVGTIAALVPIAASMAPRIGVDTAFLTAVVTGGSFFGDNLSFISDTTIAATQTMGCKMSDKFRVNLMIVLPAALITLALYIFQGSDVTALETTDEVSFIKTIPYLIVLVLAMSGMEVLLVLLTGLASTLIIGLFQGQGILAFLSASSEGIMGMTELILVTLMAAGMLEIIRLGGGIDLLTQRLSCFLKSTVKAELGIAFLVMLTNMCTANNTIAILTAAPIVRPISERLNVDARKVASIMDTFSCLVQALIPYGAQILIASSLSGQMPLDIIASMYYPMIMGACAFLAILLRFPRKYSLPRKL